MKIRIHKIFKTITWILPTNWQGARDKIHKKSHSYVSINKITDQETFQIFIYNNCSVHSIWKHMRELHFEVLTYDTIQSKNGKNSF